MATLKRGSLSGGTAIWDSFFNSLGCPLISSSGGVVTVDNLFTISRDSSNRFVVSIGSSTPYTGAHNSPSHTTVVYNDKLVYVQVHDPQSRRFAVLYEKVDDLVLFGTCGTSGNVTGVPWFSLNDFNLTDQITSAVYMHNKRLNYACNSDYIDFTTHMLSNNGYRTDIIDNNFVDCSSISGDIVISFNGSNYYTIGTNALISLD